jgi:hypothetical protein
MPVPRRSGESAPPRLEEPDQHIQQDRQQQRDREGDQKAARRTAVDPYATVRGLRCKWISCRHCVNLAIGLDLQTATRETKAVVHAERPVEEAPAAGQLRRYRPSRPTSCRTGRGVTLYAQRRRCSTEDYRYGRWCTCPRRPSEGRTVVGEIDSCMRPTAPAARSLAWSTSPSGAVDPNTVYVIAPLFKTSSTTSHVPGKRPWILTPGSGTACTHRISDECAVINTRQTFGSGDTACGILS